MSPLAYIKALLGMALAAMFFFSGLSCGKATIAKKDAALTKASDSLRNAERVLTTNALAFKDIDAVASHEIAEAQKRAKLAEEFGYRAAEAQRKAEKREAAFAAGLAAAKRRAPCKSLLETDLEAVCGLQLQ